MYPIQKNNFSLSNSVKASFPESRYRKNIHIHQLLELVYVIDGEMTVKTHGKKTIAKKGDIILVHPYQAHGFYTEDGRITKLWMLLFSNALVADIIKNNFSYKDYQNAVFTPSDELKTFLESKMFDTNAELVELSTNEILSMKALLYPVFDEYIKKVPDKIVPNKNYSTLVNSILSYLQNNFYQDITIDDCAKEIGYSKSHISHSLTQTLGTTFLDLRNLYRMDYAKALFLNTDMNIYRISLECGFNCERSFERVFKKYHGITPKKYRDKTIARKQSENINPISNQKNRE